MENFNLLEQAAKVEQAAKDGNYELAHELTVNSVESLKQAVKNNPQDAEKYLSQIEKGVAVLHNQMVAVV